VSGGGAFQSNNAGASFDALANAPQLACIGQREDGELFACGANWQPDFKAVAKSADAVEWNKVFRFVELAGPLECAAGTPQADMCGSLWPMVQEQFGTTGPGTCGVVEPTHDTPPSKPSGGCCGASNGSVGQLGATALLVALCGAHTLRRRRR